MPVTLAVDDKLQVTCYCKTASQLGVNVLGYAVTAVAGAGATLQQVADALDLVLSDEYKAVICGSARWEGVGVKRVSPGTPTEPAYGITNAGNGTGLGDLLPTQTAAVISKRTGLAGRSQRGRVYVPFPGEDDSGLTAIPTAGYMTRLQALAAELLLPRNIGGGGDTVTIIPVLANGTNPASVIPITAMVARNRWGTQRRRGSFGQANTLPF